jgi:hypothetical protein
VRGAVVHGFTYDRTQPFGAGARRGIDLATRPGEVVRAACGGVVTFAGREPAARTLGVTVRCGELAATHLRLSRLAVRRGDTVWAGRAIGRAAARTIRLGARRAGDPFGYVDPRALLRRAGPTLGPAPVAVPRRRVVRPLPEERPAPSRAPEPEPEPAGFPPVAWLGIALLAAATGTGAIVRRRGARTSALPAPGAARLDG